MLRRAQKSIRLHLIITRSMTALISDERWIASANIIILYTKIQLAISRTSVATYKLTEPSSTAPSGAKVNTSASKTENCGFESAQDAFVVKDFYYVRKYYKTDHYIYIHTMD